MTAASNGTGQHPVQLYVYDLSNGMARALSMQLTGRHFDAIYHTSIVVHGREWYFGQGIHSAAPGRTHFGNPIERVDLGSTSIDKETFTELLQDLAERFHASAYHLLTFNCNTFSNEVANILVGRDIPSHITSLPEDFMQTPFGAMMRPHIESMFGAAAPSEQRIDAPQSSTAAAAAHPAATGLLNGIAQQAYNGPSTSKMPTSAAVIREIRTPAELKELQSASPCLVALFTSQSCPPCNQLRPVYESLAEQYGKDDAERPIIFARIESSPAAAALMNEQGIRATPTVRFYLGVEVQKEVKGANPSALRDGIEELLWCKYRPHPHSKADSPTSLVPANPIVFAAIPNLMLAQRTLDEVTSKHKAKDWDEKDVMQSSRSVLTRILVPWIKAGPAVKRSPHIDQDEVSKYATAARLYILNLNVAEMYPVIDLLRIATSDVKQASALAEADLDLIPLIIENAKTGIDSVQQTRSTLITTYRLVSNALAAGDKTLTSSLMASSDLIALLVFGVLCEDVGVRGAAISATFNFARALAASRSRYEGVPQKQEWLAQDKTPLREAPPTDEQVEVLCAALECVEKEDDIERLHRAAAAVALLLYYAPDWSATIQPMLEVVEASSKLKAKADSLAESGGDEVAMAKAKDVRKLLEAASRLAAAS